MRDILDDLVAWYRDGVAFAVATVTGTWNSAPRPVGASMAVSEAGEVVGSVSGGCVEGAVYEVAQNVLSRGEPETHTYGVSDDNAFAVGLTCGGTIQVYCEPVTPGSFPELEDIADAVNNRRPVAVATVIAHPDGPGARLVLTPEQVAGTTHEPGLDYSIVDTGRGELSQAETGVLHFGVHGERRMDDVTVLLESFAPPPEMIVFGAIDFAAAVVRVGKFLGYHVTVCDARPVFATKRRFPDADEIVVDWPHRYLESHDINERTVLCVLTHDPKFDVPLLVQALQTPAAYIGAMGNRVTHEDRLDKLRAEGVADEALARLSSPIGLDLGGRTPEETAISIAAEIVATKWDGSGQPLSHLTSPIHK